MDIKSLMIGNWAYDTLSQTNIKVNGGCFEINPLNGIRYAENLIPIPLTPEILEKNGFIKEWDGDIIYMSFNNICIEIGSNYKVYQDGRYYIKGIVHRFYYVHQLQQALGLLGIEKQIEL